MPGIRSREERSAFLEGRGSCAEWGSGGRTRKMELVKRDCASGAGDLGACSVQDCGGVFSFGDVSPVLKDD